MLTLWSIRDSSIHAMYWKIWPQKIKTFPNLNFGKKSLLKSLTYDLCAMKHIILWYNIIKILPVNMNFRSKLSLSYCFKGISIYKRMQLSNHHRSKHQSSNKKNARTPTCLASSRVGANTNTYNRKYDVWNSVQSVLSFSF